MSTFKNKNCLTLRLAGYFCHTYTGKGGGGEGSLTPPRPKNFETANN